MRGPHTLAPKPFLFTRLTPHLQPRTLDTNPKPLHPTPCTLPETYFQIPHPTPATLNPEPQPLDLKRKSLNPTPQTLHLKPSAHTQKLKP